MNRRDLLTSAPVAFLVPSMATADTPVMRAYREWSRHWEWVNSAETVDFSNDQFDALCHHSGEAAGKLIHMPSQNCRDILAKIAAATSLCENLENENSEMAFLIEEIKSALA